jgi:predicted MPP superfamily phosphohydrolase
MSNITRRRFLGLSALALPAALGADSTLRETTTLRVTKLDHGTGPCRFVHFSDFHYKGDDEFATRVVDRINELAPDFVCFTGDLVEEAQFAPGAFGFIRKIQAPVYGTPGNHDYESGVPLADFREAFSATGGAWLANDRIVLPAYDLELVGFGKRGVQAFKAPETGRQILLLHFPKDTMNLGRQFDLILAGHSHGGQVRLPIVGALVLPKGVGAYEQGYFETPAGPLYVNAGIGTYRIPFRWNCRPELTLITI